MTLLILYHKKIQESICNEKLGEDFGYENGKKREIWLIREAGGEEEKE